MDPWLMVIAVSGLGLTGLGAYRIYHEDRAGFYDLTIGIIFTVIATFLVARS
jgi:hypothetical protein